LLFYLNALELGTITLSDFREIKTLRLQASHVSSIHSLRGFHKTYTDPYN